MGTRSRLPEPPESAESGVVVAEPARHVRAGGSSGDARPVQVPSASPYRRLVPEPAAAPVPADEQSETPVRGSAGPDDPCGSLRVDRDAHGLRALRIRPLPATGPDERA